MMKKIVAAMILLSLLLTSGCDQTSIKPAASSTGSTIVKTAELAGQWNLNQMRLEVKATDELSLLLKLASGETADGYFYLEKGKNINFRITGNSLVYESKAAEDRFSFTAGQNQGSTYTLIFKNNTDSSITLFLELIYPLTGSMYVPVKAE
jgi:hypothetical protein